MSATVGRYAPSPSSTLHLGNLRTALLALAFARQDQGRFVIRVDDLDSQRSQPAIASEQLADLAALEIHSDEPIPRQSHRHADYQAAFECLKRAGRVYPCWCSRRDIADAIRAPHAPPDGYPGTCRNRMATHISQKDPAWRFAANHTPLDIDDHVFGSVRSFAGDVVVRRANGDFGYQLAVVVDDYLDGVTQVVRGADLRDSVATQVQIRNVLGFPDLAYAHVPLMIGPEGTRLSKRRGSAGLANIMTGRADVVLPGMPPTPTPRDVAAALLATAGVIDGNVDLTIPQMLLEADLSALTPEPTQLSHHER